VKVVCPLRQSRDQTRRVDSRRSFEQLDFSMHLDLFALDRRDAALAESGHREVKTV
jgi:hypothetical protein